MNNLSMIDIVDGGTCAHTGGRTYDRSHTWRPARMNSCIIYQPLFGLMMIFSTHLQKPSQPRIYLYIYIYVCKHAYKVWCVYCSYACISLYARLMQAKIMWTREREREMYSLARSSQQPLSGLSRPVGVARQLAAASSSSKRLREVCVVARG